MVLAWFSVDFVQSKLCLRRKEKVNFSFTDDCCKKIGTPVKGTMNKNSYNVTKLKRLSVIVTLLSLAFCCTGFHSFEECPHETVTQEVEFLSARQDESIVKDSQTASSFCLTPEMASSSCPSKLIAFVSVTERSAINGLGTYLRL